MLLNVVNIRNCTSDKVRASQIRDFVDIDSENVGGTELSEHFSASPPSQGELNVRILDNNPR